MELLDYTRHAGFGASEWPSKVSDQKRIWRTVLPAALLILVIGTTLRGEWHRHAIDSPDACPLCHLSHEVIEPTLASTRIYVLVPTGPGPEPERYSFVLSPATGHIPSGRPPPNRAFFHVPLPAPHPCTCPLRRLSSHASTVFAVSSFVGRNGFSRSCRWASTVNFLKPSTK
jgi:hypothetical protein